MKLYCMGASLLVAGVLGCKSAETIQASVSDGDRGGLDRCTEQRTICEARIKQLAEPVLDASTNPVDLAEAERLYAATQSLANGWLDRQKTYLVEHKKLVTSPESFNDEVGPAIEKFLGYQPALTKGLPHWRWSS